MSLDPVYTTNDVCSYFGITGKTLERWVKSGYIERYKIGGRIYFTKQQIESCIKKATT